MRPAVSAAVIFLLTGTPALAHRLDEYLQGAIISVGKDRVDAQLTLIPGVAVFPVVVAEIDVDGDGIISAIEQHAYSSRILRDLSLKIDGQVLTPRLVSMRFPAIEEMKAGRGEIQIEFAADLQPGGPHRKLTFENHHQSRIAAYQVNCLVSRDPDIRILAQNRNYSQSLYELDFVQRGVQSNPLSLARLAGAQEPLGTVALLLVASLAFLWRLRARPSKGVRRRDAECRQTERGG
jgi:hypothetical protein